jgi:hypothetical protein
VKYAYGLVLLAKEETVLQSLIGRLIETRRSYGMEMNVEKNQGNENLKGIFHSTDYDR